MTATIKAGQTLVSIQYLRGLAAFAVVAFHASHAGGFPWFAGAAGVDVFFVISGFIMWSVSEREGDPRTFMWRRIVRVVPLYWVATFVISVLNQPGWLDVVRSLFFVPFMDASGDVRPVLNPGWTLNYEMFFYALFAAVLLLPRRLQLPSLTALLGGLALTGLLFRPQSALLLTYTNTILLEFLAGVWLHQVWRSGVLRSARAGWAAIIAALSFYAAEQLFGVYSETWRFLLWGGPAVLLVAGALSLEGAGRLGDWPLLGRLGDSSYSTYLFHGLTISALEKVIEGPLLFFAGVIVAPAVGYAIWRTLEVPMTRQLRSLPSARPFTQRSRAS